MTTTEILAAFANPETMKTLSVSDSLYAGLVTTVLGMGITFAALIILLFVMALMDKVLNRKKEEAAVTAVPAAPASQPVSTPTEQADKDDGELIAAITTAIAMSLKTSTSNIIVRNIEKVENSIPEWHKAGIIEQMNSRF